MQRHCPTCDSVMVINDDRDFYYCEPCHEEELAKEKKNNVTKDVSPFGAALFNCFRSSDPMQQIAALRALERKVTKEKDE